MNIMLGNLSIKEFSEITGWNFLKEDREYLEKHRTCIAEFNEKDKFHIFRMPLSILIGEDIYEEVKSIILRYNNENQSEVSFRCERIKFMEV